MRHECNVTIKPYLVYRITLVFTRFTALLIFNTTQRSSTLLAAPWSCAGWAVRARAKCASGSWRFAAPPERAARVFPSFPSRLNGGAATRSACASARCSRRACARGSHGLLEPAQLGAVLALVHAPRRRQFGLRAALHVEALLLEPRVDQLRHCIEVPLHLPHLDAQRHKRGSHLAPHQPAAGVRLQRDDRHGLQVALLEGLDEIELARPVLAGTLLAPLDARDRGALRHTPLRAPPKQQQPRTLLDAPRCLVRLRRRRPQLPQGATAGVRTPAAVRAPAAVHTLRRWRWPVPRRWPQRARSSMRRAGVTVRWPYTWREARRTICLNTPRRLILGLELDRAHAPRPQRGVERHPAL
eukprot:scaffold110376_cov63-Phaeocystis_antarctica.AAC.2